MRASEREREDVGMSGQSNLVTGGGGDHHGCNSGLVSLESSNKTLYAEEERYVKSV